MPTVYVSPCTQNVCNEMNVSLPFKSQEIPVDYFVSFNLATLHLNNISLIYNTHVRLTLKYND
jgi:hypothetical protein